jgi:hypothetical protein
MQFTQGSDGNDEQTIVAKCRKKLRYHDDVKAERHRESRAALYEVADLYHESAEVVSGGVSAGVWQLVLNANAVDTLDPEQNSLGSISSCPVQFKLASILRR